MRLGLTALQIAELEAHLRPGIVLLARIDRESFAGTNAETSGRPFIEFGSVPASSLPALREAVKNANTPKVKKQRKGANADAAGTA